MFWREALALLRSQRDVIAVLPCHALSIVASPHGPWTAIYAVGAVGMLLVEWRPEILGAQIRRLLVERLVCCVVVEGCVDGRT